MTSSHKPTPVSGPELFAALRSVGTIELVGEANVCRDMTEVAQRIGAA